MKKRIAIIGAGFTGLTAAHELIKRGVNAQIEIFERSDVAGGLAAGFPLCGTSLEKTYHYLFLTDTCILSLARELGLEDHLLWGESTTAIFYGDRLYPFTTPLDLLRFSPCGVFDRFRLGLVMFYLQRQGNWRRFINVSAHNWMERTCGKRVTDVMWQPLLRGKFDRYANEISMAWLWARIHTRMNSRKAGGEKLGYFRGGFAVLTRRLEEVLRKAGVVLHFKATLEKIELANNRIALHLNGVRHGCDRCIFTGSSNVLAAVLPDDPSLAEYRRKLTSVTYLAAMCLIFVSDQKVGDFFWVNVHERDAPFLLFVQHTNLVGTDLYGGKHVYYIGSYQPQDSPLLAMREEELCERWFGYIKKMHPHFDSTRISERHVFKFKAAQHIVDTEYERKVPDFRTPIPGMYLSNFSQIFPEDRGTNFAVREGQRIAALVSQDLQ